VTPTPDRTPPPPDQPRRGRTIITRTPPPPVVPPFTAREPALQADPGKPLEPQQTQNVRAGRPAGPKKDPEIQLRPTAKPAQPKPAQPKPEQPKPAGRGRGDKPDSGDVKPKKPGA